MERIRARRHKPFLIWLIKEKSGALFRLCLRLGAEGGTSLLLPKTAKHTSLPALTLQLWFRFLRIECVKHWLKLSSSLQKKSQIDAMCAGSYAVHPLGDPICYGGVSLLISALPRDFRSWLRVRHDCLHGVGVGRALLLSPSVPSVFWGEAVLTAVYLLNRMPTPLLSGMSPYEKLFGQAPTYSSLRCLLSR